MPTGLVAAATAVSRFNEVGSGIGDQKKWRNKDHFMGDLLGIYYDLGDLGLHRISWGI